MKNPPNIQAAHVIEDGVLEVQWSTGETLRVNLADLPKRNTAFAPLTDPDFFARMGRDEWGHGLDWPGGLDLGADRLYELCREQAGLPTVSDFEAWLQRNGLSLSGAAEALGMTRRMIAHYRTASKPIPKVVGLACKGWEAQHAGNTDRYCGLDPQSMAPVVIAGADPQSMAPVVIAGADPQSMKSGGHGSRVVARDDIFFGGDSCRAGVTAVGRGESCREGVATAC